MLLTLATQDLLDTIPDLVLPLMLTAATDSFRPRLCGNSNFENLKRTVSQEARVWRPASERKAAVVLAGARRSGDDHA
jgi:hypothetical protein